MSIGPIPAKSHAVSFDTVKLADQTRMSGFIWQAILVYLKDRPDENFATVETLLRAHQCYTRLIATNASHPGQTPRFRGKNCSYFLFVSTQPLKEPYAKFLGFADDEQINLERLADTGILKAD
jgi:hypothetical protein